MVHRFVYTKRRGTRSSGPRRRGFATTVCATRLREHKMYNFPSLNIKIIIYGVWLTLLASCGAEDRALVGVSLESGFHVGQSTCLYVRPPEYPMVGFYRCVDPFDRGLVSEGSVRLTGPGFLVETTTTVDLDCIIDPDDNMERVPCTGVDAGSWMKP